MKTMSHPTELTDYMNFQDLLEDEEKLVRETARAFVNEKVMDIIDEHAQKEIEFAWVAGAFGGAKKAVTYKAGEKKNDEALSRRYAALCDIYVMDAFGTAHRAQASTHGAGQFAPVACAGPLLAGELDALGKSLIRETAYPGVWWLEHRNTEGEIVGRYIEITRSPEILMSQDADIGAGRAEHLRRRRQVSDEHSLAFTFFDRLLGATVDD